jgi:phage gp16-like protein
MTRQIVLSVTEDQYEHLAKRAKNKKMGVGELLMNAVLGEQPTKRKSEQDKVDEVEPTGSEKQVVNARATAPEVTKA